jgi:apolipoprotein N-acyltransferase
MRREGAGSRARPWPWLGLAGVALVLPLLLGVITNTNRQDMSSKDSLTVAMVQGNVPEPGLDFNSRRMQVLRNHVDLSLELAKRIDEGLTVKPELVIWPENSSDVDPLADLQVNRVITETVDELAAPTLVGAVIQDPNDPEKVLNAGILWQPGLGDTSLYIKQHPVLFGEFVPFRPILTRLIGRFERVPRDFGKGDTPGIFDIGGKVVGDVICFEVADDAVVRNTVRAGAQVLVVQTNNATYNLLGQTEQQLQISKVRAQEFDRYVLVAATSGISAVVSNSGEVLMQTEELTPDIIEASVPLYDYQTFSARFGHQITIFILILGLIGMIGGAIRVFTSRRKT